MMRKCTKLEDIKDHLGWAKENLDSPLDNLEVYQVDWLIEQAEIASNYGSLVMEHADLFHFKQIAKKHLTAEQLEDIQEEMEDVPETSF